MECKLKHLEFIQNVITRMNSNSFLIKGWMITLVSALSAIADQSSKEHYLVVILVFWFLDGFFLSQERQYRALYNTVSIKKKEEIDFSMKTKEYNKDNNTWIKSVLSKTLILFYGFSLVVFFGIN